MLKRQKVSLNQISQDSAKKLIKTALDKKVNVRKIYVDTVGPATSYQALLKNSLEDKTIEVTVEPKADAKYECVSAASIVAKVTRDKKIEIIEKEDENVVVGTPRIQKRKNG